ncbi:hypothetical protein GW17_00053625 [Ensete ventricosum]|nr:hypothetical protein GW17_00053625 [Ensete ventricosum]
MVKHHGESSKMGQAGPLLQAAAVGLQVQTRSQTIIAAHEERGSEQDKREVGYSPLMEEAPLEPQLGKRATRRDLQWRKPALIFLKRAWRTQPRLAKATWGRELIRRS